MANMSFHELLRNPVGTAIPKRDLFDLIQYSKVPGSPYWSGSDFIINNTPQQGINWVGELPLLSGVILKVKDGSYIHDGWQGTDRNRYRYSFKARNGAISLKEKANLALLNQAEFGYPVLLYSELKNNWIFEGFFEIFECADEYVTLARRSETYAAIGKAGQGFTEGGKVYVTHLLSERNPQIVKILKLSKGSVCEICKLDFKVKYGVEYIEAHHKIMLSSLTERKAVSISDFALLCSNCHSAVHCYMREGAGVYDDIKQLILSRL